MYNDNSFLLQGVSTSAPSFLISTQQSLTLNHQNAAFSDNLAEFSTNSFSSTLFRLYNESKQHQLFKGFDKWIILIFNQITVILLLFWSPIERVWDGGSFCESLFKVLSSLIRFKYDWSYSISIFPFVFVCIWYLLHFLVFLFLFRSFRKQGALDVITYQVFTFLVTIGNETFFPLTAYTLGSTFSGIFQLETFSLIAFFVLLVVLIYILLIIWTTHTFFNYLTNPTNDILASFDGNDNIKVISNCCFSMILYLFLNQLGSKLYIIAHLTRIAYSVYCALITLQFPFVSKYINMTSAAYCFSMIASDLLCIIDSFISMNKITILILPIVVYVIAFILNWFLINHRLRIVHTLLSPNLTSEADIDKYFNNIDVVSVQQAKTLIRGGFIMNSISVLNGRFPYMVGQKFDDYDLWYLIGSLASFIPANQSLLQQSIDNMSNQYPHHFNQKAKLLLLIHASNARQQSGSVDITSDLEKMRALTQDAIITVKQYWANTPNDNEVRLLLVTETLERAQQQWSETLMLIPHDTVLLHEYSRFLGECLGQIEKSCEYQIKSDSVLHGYRGGFDPLFQQFIITKPELYREGILNQKGQFLVSNGALSESQAGTSEAGTTSYPVESEVVTPEAMMNEKYRFPKLRSALIRTTTQYKPKNFECSMILYGIVFAILVGFLIASVFLIYEIYDPVATDYHIAVLLADSFKSLSNARQAIILDYVKSLGLLFTKEQYDTALSPISPDDIPMVDPFDLTESITYWGTDFVNKYVEFFRIITENDILGKYMSYINEDIAVPIFNNDLDIVYSDNITNMEAFIRLVNVHNDYFKSANYPTNSFTESAFFMEGGILDYQFGTSIASFIPHIFNNIDSELDNVWLEIVILMVCFVVIFIVGLFFIYLPVCIESKTIDSIVTIHKNLPANVLQEATRPIAAHDEEQIDLSAPQPASNRANYMIRWLVRSIAVYVIIFIMALVGYLYSLLAISSTSDYMNVVHYAFARDCYIHISGNLLVTQRLALIEPCEVTDYILDEISNTNYSQQIILFNKYFESPPSGKGIFDLSPEIREIYLGDQCSANISIKDLHPFYSCIGLERAISGFNILSEKVLIQAKSQTRDELFVNGYFINCWHLLNSELFKMAEESESTLSDIIKEKETLPVLVTCILLILSIVFLICVAIPVDIQIHTKAKEIINALMILMRHLPPHAVQSNQEILSLFVKSKKKQSKANEDPRHLVYLKTTTPVLDISEGFVIESMNLAFMNAFHYNENDLVGCPLDRVIPEQGAGGADLYESLRQMATNLTKKLYTKVRVKAVCGNENNVDADASVYGILDRNGIVSTFAIFLEDADNGAAGAVLEQTKKEIERISDQLIPPPLQDSYGFALSSQTSTVIVVKIHDAMSYVTDSSNQLEQILNSVEVLLADYPTITEIRSFYHTLVFISSLFNEEDDHANTAFQFATDAKRVLEENARVNYSISIHTGGPFACGVLEGRNDFDVLSEAINDSLELIDLAPEHGIVITQSTKSLLPDEANEYLNMGSTFDGKTTYYA